MTDMITSIIQQNEAMVVRGAVENDKRTVDNIVRLTIRRVVNRDNFSCGEGIALTDALSENIFIVLLTVLSEKGSALAAASSGSPGAAKPSRCASSPGT